MNKLVYIINNKKNSTNEEIKNEIQLKANEIDNTNIVKITCKPTNTTSDYVSLQMKMPILTHDGPFDTNPVIGEKPFYRVSPVYNQEFLGIESETKNQGIINTWFSSKFRDHYDEESYKKDIEHFSQYNNMIYWSNILYAPSIASSEFSTLSDLKIKKNLMRISNSQDVLKKINIYEYNKILDKNLNIKEIGMIAQEIEKDSGIIIFCKKKNENKLLELSYNNIFCLGLQYVKI